MEMSMRGTRFTFYPWKSHVPKKNWVHLCESMRHLNICGFVYFLDNVYVLDSTKKGTQYKSSKIQSGITLEIPKGTTLSVVFFLYFEKYIFWLTNGTLNLGRFVLGAVFLWIILLTSHEWNKHIVAWNEPLIIKVVSVEYVTILSIHYPR